ncbi:Pimeloyl-ACP methyl ester carboxylesterase [Tessaracoccus bendigoensis DSM 12906]|uniref:Pimeloyl-ACP methyl ester carboxylesterase n=1 Tax=Tessaracoccus bendigoensis DSM 12906 TaxID=1123357 RepID=A0A1M6KR08_9ACTN|nr:alpha/beta hydrolase [Tessaracoccus bendigoensis]SHJ61408.1 Pimeloyl-ACP methyl ester carboxylesterase [Tessaracoccus bendigoensis DSM 12906]
MTLTRHIGAVVVAVIAGLGCAWGMPRGPLDGVDVVASVALCLGAGVLAGWIAGSRIVMLTGPVALGIALELGRAHLVGPTVDAPHLSLYGAIALILGRGVQAVFTVLPIILGASLGAALRRRNQGQTPGRGVWARRVGTVALAGVVVAATAVAAVPGRTQPIISADGTPQPGSIAELTRIPVDRHELGVMIRGRSTDNPVLLFLPGGPGGSELGAMRSDAGLETDFIVATLDPRGAGASYDQLDPTSSLTLESQVDDAIAVTEHLRDRFGQERVFIVGQSYGTLISVLCAARRPDLYRGLVGTGQMVSVLETDRVTYADKLAWAEEAGQTDLAAELRRIGEPPYADVIDYEVAVSGEQDLYPYDRSGNAEGAGGFSEHIFADEYSVLQRLHNLPAFLDTFAVLYPQLQDLDLRDSVTSLEVPVLLVQGRHETPGRSGPARDWFDALDAPEGKTWVELETSGHRPIFEQPAQFQAAMRAFAVNT